MGVIDYLRAIYPANNAHNSNDPSVFVHGTMSLAGGITISSSTFSIGSVGQSGSWTTAITDSSGNSIIATNTMPKWTEQGAIVRPIFPTSVNAALSNVSGTTGSVIVVTTDGTRKGMLIVNDSTANLLVKYGLTASASSYSVRMLTLSYWEMPQPIWQGEIDAIWDSANTGVARITIIT